MARGIRKDTVPYLVRIRGIWHYERDLKPGLTVTWNGKAVRRIRVSLSTVDKAEAVSAWAVVHTAAEQAISDTGKVEVDINEYLDVTEQMKVERDERRRTKLQARYRELSVLLREKNPPVPLCQRACDTLMCVV
jgi:hypothetical protein